MYTTISNPYDTQGKELAEALKFNGIAILSIAMAALKEANFHHEAAKVDEMICNLIPF